MKLRSITSLILIASMFAIFLLWPIAHVVKIGLRFDILLAVFRDDSLRRGLINSALIAVAVTVLCTIIALPLAVLAVRYDFAGKKLFSGLLLVPLILPPFVGAIGMRQILGRFGAMTALVQHLGFVATGTPIDWLGRARLLG